MARPVTLHQLVKIKADANGDAPKTIELLRTGNWHTPYHGDFEITTADLHQFVANAKSGIGLVAADPKIPGNYGHESWEKAAAWVDPQAGQLYVSDDGQALIGEPEWTPAARDAIKAGEWKYISPEFNPRSVPWEDPEEAMSFVENVLTGFALTNIPLFKKLKPVQASRVKGSSDTSTKQEGESMDLAALRAKEVKDLSDEEKTFLSEHKAELTQEELEKFSLADDAAGDDDKGGDAADDDKQDDKSGDSDDSNVNASRKTVSISADHLAKLEADARAGVEAAQKLVRNEADAFATEAIKAGRIKSDQKETLVERLVKASSEERTFLEDFVAALPENKDLGIENGHNGGTTVLTASEELDQAAEKIKADKNISYTQAVKQALAADAGLRQRVDAERK